MNTAELKCWTYLILQEHENFEDFIVFLRNDSDLQKEFDIVTAIIIRACNLCKVKYNPVVGQDENEEKVKAAIRETVKNYYEHDKFRSKIFIREEGKRLGFPLNF